MPDLVPCTPMIGFPWSTSSCCRSPGWSTDAANSSGPELNSVAVTTVDMIGTPGSKDIPLPIWLYEAICNYMSMFRVHRTSFSYHAHGYSAGNAAQAISDGDTRLSGGLQCDGRTGTPGSREGLPSSLHLRGTREPRTWNQPDSRPTLSRKMRFKAILKQRCKKGDSESPTSVFCTQEHGFGAAEPEPTLFEGAALPVPPSPTHGQRGSYL